MRKSEKKHVLGIVADEDAMFDILAKFLTKEGYEVERVIHEIGEEEDLSLIIHAPTRSSDRSKNFFKNLKKKKIIIAQSGDDEYSEIDDNTILFSERPLNLKQLSDTIEKALSRSNQDVTVH
ncbi:MAG TPA: hypothetical protein VLX91_03695 [Candidatus Acidoferrales bacterium]|nr:hypothetical protein [Candidatus Acidoferrales bacterium]